MENQGTFLLWVDRENGPRTAVFNRFNRWSQRDLWQGLFAALADCEDPSPTAMVDSTAVKARCSAAGASTPYS